MSPPHPASKPALRLNTKGGHPRLAGVHFNAPLRPRASTRGSPVEVIGNSPPFLSQPVYGPGSSDSEGESQRRGRPPGAVGPAGSGLHPSQPLVEQRSLPSEIEDVEQSLKEPQPPERVHTNLFCILASSTTFNEMDLTGFGGHRDTLATLTLRLVRHSQNLPIAVFSHIVHYLDFQTYKSVRLTCRGWSAAFTYVRPLRLPPIYALPAEIIKDVYAYLSPLDVNAARHTCPKWMIASLEHRLLAQVLKKAGLQGASEADTARNEKLGHPLGGEWCLSKRLATECSLGPGWTGNGFSDPLNNPSPLRLGSSDNEAASQGHNLTSLEISCTIGFADLLRSRQSRRQDQPSTLRFTVSICGRFLLVLDNAVIYVFCIRDLSSPFPQYQHGGHIEFLIAIVCPGSILAVGMDSSRDRYTIAVLLDDRMGLIMDIPELSLVARRSGSSSPHSECNTHNVTEAWELKASPTATPTTSQRPGLPPTYTDIYHASPIAQIPSLGQPSPLPVQFIPHTLYRNLCSKTSPPLSVAICPHRRCVAFGCSAGIELHWQDARTGQHLSRWMELIGPAEYINFLPPRPEDENDLAKKLRLSSSRSRPTYYHDPITLNDAWDYEHCKFLRAVPLSDGKHLLYTDPASGDLCVGTGLHYPFGRPKPVKKFVLEGPGYPFETKGKWSTCYKASPELDWGARIVAGFGDQIWLFCVRPDFLSDNIDSDSALDERLYPKKKDGTTIIGGARIGEIPDLVELAVDGSNGDLTIYAFSNSAPAKVFQIARYPRRDIKERIIASDDWVVNQDKDRNQNLVMKGYVPNPENAQRKEHDSFGLENTVYRRLDGHDLPLDDQYAADSGNEDDELKEHAVGDRIHDANDTGEEDEGYVSDDEDAQRTREWGWNDAANGDDEEPDRSREGSWDVMELVRLEVEVLCGG
ncbi:MAG: hypothetical protein Q9225_002360 [Loekoesia sp. 1 TL-2023]